MIKLLFFLATAAQADFILLEKGKDIQITFKDFKNITLAVAPGKMIDKEYQAIMRDLKKTKKFSVGKHPGNPASVFCEKAMNGQNKTLIDPGENEYAICVLKSGTMVDAWELFRLKP